MVEAGATNAGGVTMDSLLALGEIKVSFCLLFFSLAFLLEKRNLRRKKEKKWPARV